MTKVDIFSGFLGAGKTTLIKKLIKEAYAGEKIVLIENEFGEIGIDGGFMKEAGIEVNEMNSGCICCSLVGDFGEALKKVVSEYAPDRILIEPSGVGKLSDVIKAVMNVKDENMLLNSFTAVADAKKCKMYMKNFGEFFNDQIEHAGCIVLSHTGGLPEGKIEEDIKLIKHHNPDAVIVTTDWDMLDGKQLQGALERKSTLMNAIERLEEEQRGVCHICGHHHGSGHHHDHENHHDCDCHEHHHDHEHHEHHEHHDCDCHEHHHEHEHHDHDCHNHHEHGHHHHHADDVFESWGTETSKAYTAEEIKEILDKLSNEEEYGVILRAKGIVNSDASEWIHFDYIPDEPDVRTGSSDIIGRLCVIGAGINKEKLAELFGV